MQREFDLILTSAPSQVRLEQPFVVEFEVRNLSDRIVELRLQLIKERMVSILPCGVSSRVRLPVLIVLNRVAVP